MITMTEGYNNRQLRQILRHEIFSPGLGVRFQVKDVRKRIEETYGVNIDPRVVSSMLRHYGEYLRIVKRDARNGHIYEIVRIPKRARVDE